MHTQLLRSRTTRISGVCRLLSLALLVVSPDLALAQGGAPLVGVWGASIQPRDCATGAALGPPIRALYTYHQDGTVLVSPGALAFMPGQRSVGHGTWTHSHGGMFVERVVALILFTTSPGTPMGSPGFQAGWEVNTATITMTDADHFTSTGGAQFFDTNRQQYRSSCPTRTAERFK
jgi:hypothetical protein